MNGIVTTPTSHLILIYNKAEPFLGDSPANPNWAESSGITTSTTKT